MTPRVALAVVCSVAIVGPGCKRKAADKPADTRIVVDNIDVKDFTITRLQVPGFTAAHLEGTVRIALEKTKRIRVRDAREKGGYSLKVNIGLDERGEGKQRRVIALISARASERGNLEGLSLQASALAKMKLANPSAEQRRRHLVRMIDAAMADLGYQAHLAAMTAPALIAELKKKDVQALRVAVGIAANRRLGATVPALIGLLAHRDTAVADRALGALAAVGDQRAIRPLTRLTKFRDTKRMAKVLDAIASIGGPEAREYLVFVAGGHPDEDIRNIASEAIERMKGRAGATK